jgi:hypothetical protein
MKKLVKLGLRLVVVVLIVATAGVLAAFYYANHLVKTGVERGGTYALGVDTTLGGAKLAIFSGTCEMTGLQIANPTGFDSPHFFTMEDSSVQVTLASLRQDEVEVPLLRLKGLDVHLQRKGPNSNYKVIIDNLARLENKDDKQKQDEAGRKKFIIRRAVIEDVTVTVDLLPIGGSLSRTTLRIPLIELKDVGSDTDHGMLLSDVSGVLVKAVLKAIAEKGRGLPGDIGPELTNQLARLQDMSKFGVEVVGNVTSQVQQVGQILGDQTQKITEGLQQITGDAPKAIDNVTRGLGNLLGGDKDKDKQD